MQRLQKCVENCWVFLSELALYSCKWLVLWLCSAQRYSAIAEYKRWPKHSLFALLSVLMHTCLLSFRLHDITVSIKYCVSGTICPQENMLSKHLLFRFHSPSVKCTLKLVYSSHVPRPDVCGYRKIRDGCKIREQALFSIVFYTLNKITNNN